MWLSLDIMRVGRMVHKRLAHNQEIAGSTPVPATNSIKRGKYDNNHRYFSSFYNLMANIKAIHSIVNRKGERKV